MQVFAAAVKAQKQNGFVTTTHVCAVTFTADNPDAAWGVARRLAEGMYKTVDGFCDIAVLSLCSVNDEAIKACGWVKPD